MRWLHVLFGFSGRIGRRTFWLGSVALLLVLMVMLVGFAGLMRPTGATQTELAILYISLVVALWISAALIIKRLHDRDKSALWYPVLGLGPFVAYWLGNEFSSNISNQLSAAQLGFWLLSLGLWIWALVELGFMAGTSGANRYGTDTRARPDADLSAGGAA